MLLLFLLASPGLEAQTGCPPNIGFEEASFANWECFGGSISRAGDLTLVPGPPLAGIHTIYRKQSNPGVDLFGNFPKSCPNGSNYSIQLGNAVPGSGAERISYTLTVPPNQDDYSIIYNYAVVIQNPDHLSFEQPKFTSKVFDVAENKYIDCASFEFIASANLPGFQVSDYQRDVFFKPWSAVTINLFGLAGKTLRLEFTNNDCALGGHFGYVYLDVNENCNSPISGTVLCPGDANLTLTAPSGFEGYNWYNASVTQLLGTGPVLHISPAPLVTTTYALQIIPYPGLGCLDTLYTTIKFANDIYNFRVKDSLEGCFGKAFNFLTANATAGSSSNLAFTYFTDSATMQFVPNPEHVPNAGTYYIKGTSPAGCTVVKPIKLVLQQAPTISITDPAPVHYPETVDITQPYITAGSQAGLQYTYYADANALQPLPRPDRISRSGTYFVKGVTALGCFTMAAIHVVVGPPVPFTIIAPNVFSPNGDGINDLFRIGFKGEVQVTNLYIYNRYGQRVFETNNITTGWDGNYKQRPLPVATYYWLAAGIDLYTNKQIQRAGSVSLIR